MLENVYCQLTHKECVLLPNRIRINKKLKEREEREGERRREREGERGTTPTTPITSTSPTTPTALQFTASQQQNHPTNNAPPESKKAKQEAGRYYPHKKSFNTSASPNTEQITQDKKNHKYQNNPTKTEQNQGTLK